MLFGRSSATCAPLRACSIAAVAALVGFSAAEAQDPPEVSAADYARAEQFIPWNLAGLVRNVDVAPNWRHTGLPILYDGPFPPPMDEE